MTKIAGFSSVFAIQSIFFKKYRPLESSNILILPTDQPYFFTVLLVDQNINLVLP